MTRWIWIATLKGGRTECCWRGFDEDGCCAGCGQDIDFGWSTIKRGMKRRKSR